MYVWHNELGHYDKAGGYGTDMIAVHARTLKTAKALALAVLVDHMKDRNYNNLAIELHSEPEVIAGQGVVVCSYYE